MCDVRALRRVDVYKKIKLFTNTVIEFNVGATRSCLPFRRRRLRVQRLCDKNQNTQTQLVSIRNF